MAAAKRRCNPHLPSVQACRPSGVDGPVAHLDAYQRGAAKPIAPAPGRSYNLSYREIAALEDGMLRARLLARHRDVSFHVLKELRARLRTFAHVCTWGGGEGEGE